jgi:DNA-binding GntR family transcriptional regulator
VSVSPDPVIEEAAPATTSSSRRRAPISGRRLVLEVHAALREMIISGELPPGAPLLQAEMARRLNVSRTPMREAFRLLQEEGLIENQPDQRAFVREVDPAELDSVYTTRVMLEAVAVSITIRVATADHVDRMNSALQQMRAHQADDDIDRWQEAHHQLHCIATEGAGPNLQNSITSLRETGERFLRLAQLGHPVPWSLWDADHEALVEAFRAHDHDGAVSVIARHLARTAFTAMADIAPHLDATATRAALNLIL